MLKMNKNMYKRKEKQLKLFIEPCNSLASALRLSRHFFHAFQVAEF